MLRRSDDLGAMEKKIMAKYAHGVHAQFDRLPALNPPGAKLYLLLLHNLGKTSRLVSPNPRPH